MDVVAPASGDTAQVWVIKSVGTKLFVGGNYMINSDVNTAWLNIFEGGAWSPLPGYPDEARFNHEVYALEVVGENLFIGGRFSFVLSQASQGLARYNLTSQQLFPVGGYINNYVFTLATDGTELFLGGNFTQVQGAPSGPLARYNYPTFP